mgnify:CR=1 FL=1
MNSLVQFIKFSVVGVSNTIIAFGVYYLLLWLDINYLLANTLSWIISVFNAFFWNNRYVFKTEVHWFKSLVKTYIAYFVSLILGLIVLYVLVDILLISKLIAPIYTLFFTIPINFLLNKFWTFRTIKKYREKRNENG